MIHNHNVVLFCMAWLVLGKADATEKPTRRECIVGFNLDWSRIKSDRHDVRNSLRDWPSESQRIADLTAMSISLDGSKIYFQFRKNCYKREEMTTALIGYWRSKGLDLPRFERIEGTVTPSTRTIDVSGLDWRDNN